MDLVSTDRVSGFRKKRSDLKFSRKPLLRADKNLKKLENVKNFNIF